MGITNNTSLKATEFIGRGLYHGLTPEQREVITSLSSEDQDKLKANLFYEKKYNLTNLTSDVVSSLIEEEYGLGTTFKTANQENSKPFNYSTLVDMPDGDKIKVLSSASDNNDVVGLVSDYIIENKGFQEREKRRQETGSAVAPKDEWIQIIPTDPFHTELEKIGTDENGYDVFEEKLVPHFEGAEKLIELKKDFDYLTTEIAPDIDGYRIEAAKRIEKLREIIPGFRFGQAALETFLGTDVEDLDELRSRLPQETIDAATDNIFTDSDKKVLELLLLPEETGLQKFEEVAGGLTGFISSLFFFRFVGGYSPSGVVAAGRSGVASIPAIGKNLDKIATNPALVKKFGMSGATATARGIEKALNYGAIGGAYGVRDSFGAIGQDLTTPEKITNIAKSTAFGMVFGFGDELIALRSIKGTALAITAVGGAGMALSPKNTSMEERLLNGGMSVLLFLLMNGVSRSVANRRTTEWFKANGLDEKQAKSVLDRFNFGNNRSMADRMDLLLRQYQAQLRTAKFKKPTTRIDEPSVPTEQPQTKSAVRERVLLEVGQNARIAPTLADARRINNFMSLSQRNDLVNSTETTPKGKRLLLNMYNNPNQKTLEEYRNFKYNNFFKPIEEVKDTQEVKPTEIKPYREKNIPTEEGGNLSPATFESLEKLGYDPSKSEKTQAVTTDKTYKKIFDLLENKNVKILDFAAGKGFGTKLGKELKLNIVGYEPFSNPKTRQVKPEYTESNQIPSNEFDIIINNAVLNVVPENVRVEILQQIYNSLAVGGKAYISVRGYTPKDFANKLVNATLVGPREIITSRGTFQKFFTQDELEAFVKSVLPDAEISTDKFGDKKIVITKTKESTTEVTPTEVTPTEVTPTFVEDLKTIKNTNDYTVSVKEIKIAGKSIDITFTYKDGTKTAAILTPQQDSVDIKSLVSDVKGQGRGTQLMQEIIKLADKNNTKLTATAYNFTKSPVDFYKKLGFKVDGEDAFGASFVSYTPKAVTPTEVTPTKTLVIKTKKGSVIKRYQDNVGKRVGSKIYVHKNYASEIVPKDILDAAIAKLPGDFAYNTITYDTKTQSVRFDEAPNFNTATEPRVGKIFTVNKDGTTKQSSSNSIWHHKWTWVKDDYTGFNVNASRDWSATYSPQLDRPKGTQASWDKQLQEAGIPKPLEEVSLQDELPAPIDFTEFEGLRKQDVEAVFSFKLPVNEANAFNEVIVDARREGFVDNAFTIARSIVENPRPHTNKEFVGFLIRSRELRDQIDALQEGEMSIDNAMAIMAFDDELTTIAAAAQISGQNLGAAFGIRQLLFSDSYAYEDVLVRLIKRKGELASDQEKEFLRQVTGNLKNVEKDLAVAEKEKLKQDADDAIKNIKKRDGYRSNPIKVQELKDTIKASIDAGELDQVAIYKLAQDIILSGKAKKLDEVVKIIKKDFSVLKEQEILDGISNRSRAATVLPKGRKLLLKQLRQEALLKSKYIDALKNTFDPERLSTPTTKEMENYQQSLKLLKAHYNKSRIPYKQRRAALLAIEKADDMLQNHWREVKLPKPNDAELQASVNKLNDILEQIKLVDSNTDLLEKIQGNIIETKEKIKINPSEALSELRIQNQLLRQQYNRLVVAAKAKIPKADKDVIPQIQGKIDQLSEMIDKEFRATRPIQRPGTPAQDAKKAELKELQAKRRLLDKVYDLQEKLNITVTRTDGTIEMIPRTANLQKINPVRLPDVFKTNKEIAQVVKDLNSLIKLYNPPKTKEKNKIINLEKKYKQVTDEIEKAYRSYRPPRPLDSKEVIDARSKVNQQLSIQRLLDDIADLDEQVRTGEFKSDWKYKPAKDEKLQNQIEDLKIQKSILQNKIDAKIAESTPLSKRKLAFQIFDIPRSLVLSLDVGHVARQGMAYFLNGGGLNSFVLIKDSFQMLMYGGQKKANELEALINNNEHYGLAKVSGVRFIEEGITDLTKREELLTNNFISNARVIGPAIDASVRTQRIGTNLIRMSAFSTFVEANPGASMQEYKDFALLLNIMTGYGSGKLFGTSRLANYSLTSARFSESLLERPFAEFYASKESTKAKEQFRKTMLAAFALRGLVMGLLAVSQDNITIGRNPNHWTFGRLIIDDGNGYVSVYDPFGGLIQVIGMVASASLFFATRIPGMPEEFRRGEFKPSIVFDYLGKRITPSVSLYYRLFDKSKYASDEEVSYGEAFLRGIAPITVQTVEQGIAAGESASAIVAKTVLDNIGIPVTRIPKKELRGKGGFGYKYYFRETKK